MQKSGWRSNLHGFAKRSHPVQGSLHIFERLLAALAVQRRYWVPGNASLLAQDPTVQAVDNVVKFV